MNMLIIGESNTEKISILRLTVQTYEELIVGEIDNVFCIRSSQSQSQLQHAHHCRLYKVVMVIKYLQISPSPNASEGNF